MWHAATATPALRSSSVAACHVRYMNPLPPKLGEMLRNFKRVLVPEMNLGQLRLLLRSKYLVDAKGLNKVRGQPFTIGEIVAGAKSLLGGEVPAGAQEIQMAGVEDAGIGGGG